MDREHLEQALRAFASAIYSDFFGAYGVGDGHGYCGYWESEIKLVEHTRLPDPRED